MKSSNTRNSNNNKFVITIFTSTLCFVIFVVAVTVGSSLVNARPRKAVDLGEEADGLHDKLNNLNIDDAVQDLARYRKRQSKNVNSNKKNRGVRVRFVDDENPVVNPGEEDPRSPDQIEEDKRRNQQLLQENQGSSIKAQHKLIEEREKEFDAAGGSFFDFPKTTKSEKCISGEQQDPLVANENKKPETFFFDQIRKSARTVCKNIRPLRVYEKSVSRSAKNSQPDTSTFSAKNSKVTEFTTKFGDGSTIGIQLYENLMLPLADVVENLEEYTCDVVIVKQSSDDAGEGGASSPSSSPHFTNFRGEKFVPDWFLHHHDKQSGDDKKQINNKEKNGGDEKQHNSNKPQIRGTPQEPLKIDIFPSPVIRIDRPRIGNTLSNLEFLFNIYVATQSLPSFAFAKNTNGNEELKIIFKDNSRTIRWADFTFFRNFIGDHKNPFFDLLVEDSWSDYVNRYVLGDNGGSSTTEKEKMMVQFPAIVEFSTTPLTSFIDLHHHRLESTSAAATTSSSSSSSSCPSPIFHKFVNWFYFRVGLDPNPSPRERSDRALRVLWVSRGPTRDRYKQKTMYLPKRRLKDEMQFLIDLADELGTGVDLQQIDFGEKTAVESLAPIKNYDVIAGVHGSGLSWASFLPKGRSALVEVFTHDLVTVPVHAAAAAASSSASSSSSSSSTKASSSSLVIASSVIAASPYRKIASLVGIEYASVVLSDTRYVDPAFTLPFPGEQKEILWNEKHVKKIADAIKQKLPYRKKLMTSKKWCM